MEVKIAFTIDLRFKYNRFDTSDEFCREFPSRMSTVHEVKNHRFFKGFKFLNFF